MNEFTPGPWRVVESEAGGGYTIQNEMVDPDSGALMYDPIVWEMGGIDTEANARLIAAAPDLLAACEAAYEWLGRFGADAPIVFGGEAELATVLHAAIAKAHGESEAQP